MKKIIAGNQVKELDNLHLKQSEQLSHELMEVAAKAFVNWMLDFKISKSESIFIAVGSGNNGGDGFAIARLLQNQGFRVSLIRCYDKGKKLSEDAQLNLDRLPNGVDYIDLDSLSKSSGILIDAYLGVGLKGKLRPNASKIIEKLNQFEGLKISVDIPSGLPSDEMLEGMAFQTNYTSTFDFPKKSLLFPEHSLVVGELVVVDIGILYRAYDQLNSNNFYLTKADIPALHKTFHRFSHKGAFGKVLLVGGSLGKMGALILSSKSALRTGSGLVTCHLEKSERQILQIAVPEAMTLWGNPDKLENYDAIGIGPGWGLEDRNDLFLNLIKNFKKPLVLDADALNLLAANPEWLSKLPENSILTPHLGEFERLVGKSKNHLERLESAREFASKYRVILVLKGAHTVVSFPDGRQVFNSSGTHYMATGGAGDVLTGMLTAFLGMGYSPESAAICGVFHHGLAGEIAGKSKRRSLLASDIIEAIPDTYLALDIK